MKYNNRYVNWGFFNGAVEHLHLFKTYSNIGLNHSGLYTVLYTWYAVHG